MVADLSIPYAFHPATDTNRSPEEEPDGKGLAANVTCLGCEEPLVHRRQSRDKKRRAHYSHKPDSEANAAKCRESAIHIRAKDLLVQMVNHEVKLPECHQPSSVPYGRPDLPTMPRPVFTPVLATTEHKVRLPNSRYLQADVLWQNAEDQCIAIEVCYQNRKDFLHIYDYMSLDLPALEVKVYPDDDAVTIDELRARVADSEWLHEPSEPFPPWPTSEVSEDYLVSRIRQIVEREQRSSPVPDLWNGTRQLRRRPPQVKSRRGTSPSQSAVPSHSFSLLCKRGQWIKCVTCGMVQKGGA